MIFQFFLLMNVSSVKTKRPAIDKKLKKNLQMIAKATTSIKYLNFLKNS